MFVKPRNASAAARQTNVSPAIDALTTAGWSLRQLALALEKHAGYVISRTQLGNSLRAAKPPQKLLSAIWSVTKVRV